jgi:uncharacterized cupredoxin-like copper-binding protein
VIALSHEIRTKGRMLMTRVRIGIASALAVAALGTFAVAPPLAGARTAQDARTTATTIRVKGGEFYFKLSRKTLPKPGKVKFVFTNVGHLVHDFKINRKKTPLVQPGKKATLVVRFKKAGKYPYLCTVPGHAAAGMKGVFRVK